MEADSAETLTAKDPATRANNYGDRVFNTPANQPTSQVQPFSEISRLAQGKDALRVHHGREPKHASDKHSPLLPRRLQMKDFVRFLSVAHQDHGSR